ncbi:helix-turn-helix transcriptional regulator [Sinorhizobium fredii]|uniref:helix-turn-helix transcriptional regulator n=1 Tax=Rhizobium fredii TaxID=380 RepID=UPI0004B86D8E|nr:hypothetical protein [Sinorhizobium fredii]ASY70380.1 hypothetical protein SF83666_c29740 [Sinorhizobium fredii CCBAU 83666]
MKTSSPVARRSVPRLALNRAEVALAIGVSVNTVDRMVEEGFLPKPKRWHSRKLWVVAEIEAAMLEWPEDGQVEAARMTNGGLHRSLTRAFAAASRSFLLIAFSRSASSRSKISQSPSLRGYRSINSAQLNPPFWFWIALPVEWVAVKLGISGKTAIVAIVFSYLALAIGLLASLLTDFSPARRAILLVAALLAVTLIGVSDFAQREHLALIAAVPYTALISRRADGRRPDWALAFLIGCFAAIGLALKHYFALVPILLELWLLAKNRRKWQPLRPEVVAMGAVAVLYGIALVTLAPDYLSTIVPMLTTAYFGYESSWSTVLFMPPVFWWALALALVLAPWRQMHSYHVAAALSAIGFALSYFAQQKGWRYHAIPATGMLFIALAALLELHLSRVNILRNVVLVVAMSVPLVIFALIGPYKNASKGEVSQLLQDVPRGSVVMMVTANPSRIWPMVDDGGYIWPSRHFALWMLTAFSQDLQMTGELSPELTQMANLVRRQTVVDLSCSPPDVIIVDNLERSKASGLDPISFLSEDPAFGAFFANYTKVRSIERFTSYFKAAGWQPSRPKDCRTIF